MIFVIEPHHEKIINIDKFSAIEEQIQQILVLLDNNLLDLVEDIKIINQ
jgi:hypothetical protein